MQLDLQQVFNAVSDCVCTRVFTSVLLLLCTRTAAEKWLVAAVHVCLPCMYVHSCACVDVYTYTGMPLTFSLVYVCACMCE